MRKESIDLALFGEGEGAASQCAAEQAEAEANNSPTAKGDADPEVVQNSSSSLNSKEEGCLSEIARLLSIEYEGGEALVNTLRSRVARAALCERLRGRQTAKSYKALLSDMDSLSREISVKDKKELLTDKRYVSLLRAGFDPREAWEATHIDAVVERAVSEAKEKALLEAYERLKGQSQRPSENGGAGRATAKSQKSVEGLTSRGIRDILRRVENGAKIKF